MTVQATFEIKRFSKASVFIQQYSDEKKMVFVLFQDDNEKLSIAYKEMKISFAKDKRKKHFFLAIPKEEPESDVPQECYSLRFSKKSSQLTQKRNITAGILNRILKGYEEIQKNY